jgi:ABC-2 type transport system ATP-binding protein
VNPETGVMHRAVEGLDLDVAPNEFLCVLGPSGCGKSTLMRSIVGVQRVAGGTVQVLGQEAGTPALRRRVGYVTQAPSVYADLTVRQNLAYFARVLSAPHDAVGRMIETVDLAEYAETPVGRLSGGQRARASLAVALLGDPDLLVLDEPTVGLDPVLRRELWGTFRELAEGGSTLLVSSHVMDEANRCDDLVLMRDGAVIASEPRESLLQRTGQTDVEQAFLQLVGAT